MYNEIIENVKTGKTYNVRFQEYVGPIELYCTKEGVVVDSFGVEISPDGVKKLRKMERVLEKRRLWE